MTQIAQSHGCLKLIHLTVGSHILHSLISSYSEIFQLIQPSCHLFISECHSSPLNTVKYLGCMKTEHGRVSKFCRSFSIYGFPKSMGCIVNHLQSMTAGNLFYSVYIAEISIYMNWHNGTRIFCNPLLQKICIQRIVRRMNVTEYRLQTVSHNGMGGGGKGKWGGNHLPPQLQSLQHKL